MHRKYYFEVIHKQNDRGTDHVEVAVSSWSQCSGVVSAVHFVLRFSCNVRWKKSRSEMPFFIFSHSGGSCIKMWGSWLLTRSTSPCMPVSRQTFTHTHCCDLTHSKTNQPIRSWCFVAPLPVVFDFSTDESAMLLTDVAHIPQTAASHRQHPTKQQSPTADVQREDPRDSLYHGERQFHIQQRMQLMHIIFPSGWLRVTWNHCLSAVPLIDRSFLQGILPDCMYKPSYTIKDFPLQRYQGLQFVCIYFVYCLGVFLHITSYWFSIAFFNIFLWWCPAALYLFKEKHN